MLARAAVRLQSAIALAIALASTAIVLAVAPWWLAVVGPLIGLGYRTAALRPIARRERLAAAPVPEAWRELLSKRVPFYGRLTPPARRRFEGDVAVFLGEHRIYGPQGAEVPEEVKVMIGAGAAMLCHGRPDWEWPHVRDIVVHPTQWNEDGEPGDHHGIAGQVHMQGPVLFSRKQIRFGFRKPDGENVVLHELAHVLDMADGSADGSPDRFAWTAVPGWDDMVRSRLKAVRKRQAGPLRAYAGTNSAELFAVAVEVFFEQPGRLRKQDPNLYEALATLFNLDPDTGALRQPLPG
ncbi:zinc-dependent peptidase [Nannocystis pusilla]|uniref:Zinc-dependent peptidase n=1 Tax=Nannocystis pusilla TaxID=889268 RepID=A0ABS7TQG0_9BACT|nr:zinc-dependent peptidase [Nannocystis pusilla]